MKTVTYLKVNRNGKVTAFVNPPTCEANEVVVKAYLNIPDSAFEADFVMSITVPEEHAQPKLLEADFEVLE